MIGCFPLYQAGDQWSWLNWLVLKNCTLAFIQLSWYLGQLVFCQVCIHLRWNSVNICISKILFNTISILDLDTQPLDCSAHSVLWTALAVWTRPVWTIDYEIRPRYSPHAVANKKKVHEDSISSSSRPALKNEWYVWTFQWEKHIDNPFLIYFSFILFQILMRWWELFLAS